MSATNANIAGLTPPQQRSAMKSILAGTWPPLKPLPVFRYETSDYRATIDFDKLRGEWVCRQISFPSNKVQELRGELREITLALPHAQAEALVDRAEEQEQELEKDASRRLQAIRDWKENYENGPLYFLLRTFLAESQRSETDDSLRLSLTARQLQCNSKNIANVFEALSTAGGRFATLIEFAKRNQARQQIAASPQTDTSITETESAMERNTPPLEIRSAELVPALNANHLLATQQEVAESSAEPDEVPAISIRNVFQEQYQVPLAERMADNSPEPCESAASEIVDADSASLVEHPPEEARHLSAFTGLAAQLEAVQPPADRPADSSSRSPVLEISAFQLALFASLFLFAVVVFAVGLTVGRGPLGSRLREIPKSMFAFSAKSPAPAVQTNPAPSRIPAPPEVTSGIPAGANKLGSPTPSGENTKQNTSGPDHFAEARPADLNAAAIGESKPPATPAPSPRATGPVSSSPGSLAPSRPTPAIVAAPHSPRPSTILVNLPGRGGHAFWVNFPEKPIAAASSLAMSSQLSVLVSPQPARAGAHKPARLEAGQLVSFVWPAYPKGDHYGLAQVIKVRATIGPLGQVRDVRFLSGSNSLLPATTRAVRQWRYTPTLLDKKPVPAQQDLTIEFRPSAYSSQASARHPAQKLVTVK